MIDDPEHPEMRRAALELTQRLRTLARYRPQIDRETLRRVIETRDEHRRAWRLRGVDFPHLVLVCIQRLGTNNLELWREDLDLKNLRVKVVNLVRAHPSITPHEIAAALGAAYPRLRPGDLIRPIYEMDHNTDSVDARSA